MRKVKTNFARRGLTYTQIRREKDFLVYSLGWPEIVAKNDDSAPINVIGYEVWKIRVLPERKIFGSTVPKREKHPSDEDFGTYAWACPTLDHVEEVIKRERS